MLQEFVTHPPGALLYNACSSSGSIPQQHSHVHDSCTAPLPHSYSGRKTGLAHCQSLCGTVQGKKASSTMSLTNNGILPAVARISMEPHSCFQLGPGPLLITLASKQSHRLTVDFIANAVKQHTHEVRAA